MWFYTGLYLRYQVTIYIHLKLSASAFQWCIVQLSRCRIEAVTIVWSWRFFLTKRHCLTALSDNLSIARLREVFVLSWNGAGHDWESVKKDNNENWEVLIFLTREVYDIMNTILCIFQPRAHSARRPARAFYLSLWDGGAKP